MTAALRLDLDRSMLPPWCVAAVGDAQICSTRLKAMVGSRSSTAAEAFNSARK
ncbi:MAG TPA: hypothetical protein VMU87_19715 [Stellaceae bacterium]|nr:hypothetical protein [Stellaceae bacterium]